MNHKIIILILLSLIITVNSLSNEKVFFESVFDTENYNSMLTQDNDGFIWVATTGGVIKYDGYNQTLISSEDGKLLSSIVPSIYVDSDGLIWIATLSGLNKYDKETNSFEYFTSNPEEEGSICSSQFNWAPKLITEDIYGNIWIGTQGGLCKYDKETDQFTNYKNIPNNFNSLVSNNIWVVHADQLGNVWIGTDKGIDKLNVEYSNFNHYSKRYPNLTDGIVYAVTEDNDQNIWVGSEKGGLSKINISNNKISNYKHDENIQRSLANNEIFNIMCDVNNNLWLTRSYKYAVGIEKYDISKDEFELFKPGQYRAGSLAGKLYLSTFEDNSGIVWIVNNLGLIEKYDNKKPQFSPIDKIKSAMVLYEDSENNIWIGTANDGIYITDAEAREFINIKSDIINKKNISNNLISAIFEDNKKRKWITGASGEIVVIDGKNYELIKNFSIPQGKWVIRSFQQDVDDENIFWFGTEGGGLFRFDESKEEFIQYSYRKNEQASNEMSSDYIQLIVQDKKGNLWLASQGGGLIKYNKNEDKFKVYKKENDNKNSLNGVQVIDIHFDKNNKLWLSTDDGGLNKYDPAIDGFIRYGKEEGITVNSIRSIVEDKDGFLWLSSNNGLYKFNTKTEKVENNYTGYDGLLTTQYPIIPQTSLFSSSGKIWFASNNGIDTFFSHEMKKNSYKPPIVLTAVKQAGEVLYPNIATEKVKQINLNWQKNYFEFEFSALNYTLAEKSNYRYMLQGVDSDWYYSENKRFGRYSGLNGGEYLLKIQGTNNDGVWSDKEVEVKVIVTPPYWQTVSFRFIISILILSVSGLAYYVKILSMRKQHELLEKQVHERTEELETKNKELTDGIEYAKKIQNIMLPKICEIKDQFEDAFFLYKPKGIVSGDFYWYSKHDNEIFIAVVDCTGHGVPGALLATIGDLSLNKYINEDKLKDPAEILKRLNRRIQKILGSGDGRSIDGMDLALCRLNLKEKKLSFAGARNSLLCMTENGDIKRIKGTKKSIGSNLRKRDVEFETMDVELSNIDSIYLFTDGYIDQLNEENRSFSYKKFETIIRKNKGQKLAVLENKLIEELRIHMRNQDQTDDITVAGFKI